MWFLWVIVIIGAYLIGSVPFAIMIVKKRTGVDLRRVGSGNPGSTNATRAGGWGAGALVFLCDGAKAALPTLVGLLLGGQTLGAAAGLAAFLGHLYPVWSSFRGGKGAATSLGIALVLTPALGGACFGVWLIVALVSGYISLGSCVSSLLLAALGLVTGQPFAIVLVYCLLTVFLLARHRENIRRLRAGTERKGFRRH